MKIDRWDNFLRWAITTIVFGFYIALVFFSISGNWNFLFTFDYYFTTISSTSVAFLLRYIWSDKGIENEILNNPDIKARETAKKDQIKIVSNSDLIDLLQKEIDDTNEENKKKEYITYVDAKIMSLNQKGSYKLFRKSRLIKWKERKKLIQQKDFNWNIVKIKYYRYDIDELLSMFYKENPNDRRYRKSKNAKVIGSLRTNLVTVLAMAVLKGAEILVSSFNQEDILILLGQLTVFIMNINTGYKLGKGFIKEDYSQNLSDDYVFLKTFNKKYGGGL